MKKLIIENLNINQNDFKGIDQFNDFRDKAEEILGSALLIGSVLIESTNNNRLNYVEPNLKEISEDQYNEFFDLLEKFKLDKIDAKVSFLTKTVDDKKKTQKKEFTNFVREM